MSNVVKMEALTFKSTGFKEYAVYANTGKDLETSMGHIEHDVTSGYVFIPMKVHPLDPRLEVQLNALELHELANFINGLR